MPAARASVSIASGELAASVGVSTARRRASALGLERGAPIGDGRQEAHGGAPVARSEAIGGWARRRRQVKTRGLTASALRGFTCIPDDGCPYYFLVAQTERGGAAPRRDDDARPNARRGRRARDGARLLRRAPLRSGARRADAPAPRGGGAPDHARGGRDRRRRQGPRESVSDVRGGRAGARRRDRVRAHGAGRRRAPSTIRRARARLRDLGRGPGRAPRRARLARRADGAQPPRRDRAQDPRQLQAGAGRRRGPGESHNRGGYKWES